MLSFSLRLLCLTAALALVIPPCRGTVPQSQVNALMDLYHSTNGNSWYHNSNWGTGDPCSNRWFGVGCDQNNNVNYLDLTGNGLSGTIPESLSDLSFTTEVSFSNNQLFGTVPASLWNLTKVIYFYLHNNQLSGTIPSFPSSLFLQFLDLSNNQFSGSLPSSPFFTSSALRIYLSNNKFSGTIPQCFNYSSLVELYLNNNQLSGTLSPGTFGKDINVLDLSHNQLSGTLSPGTFGNGIKQIDLSHNQLSGIVSSLALGQYTGAIDLSFNQFIGDTGFFTEMINLLHFNISHNQFSGPIFTTPNDYGMHFNFSSNKLSGTIPLSLLSFYPKLISLDLSNNQLSGSIPDMVTNLASLKELTLQNNMLNGTLPKFLQTKPGYEVFNASNNAFTCPLPTWCSAPPSGNGECSPCFNPNSDYNLYCCAYSSNGCKSIAQYACGVNTCVPSLGSGLNLCGIFPTTSCSLCFSGSSFLLDRMQSINSLSSNSSRGPSKSIVIN